MQAKERSGARATITVCRGRAGVRRNSSIRAPRCSTTPRSRSRKAAAPSAPASASSVRKSCLTARPAKSACWQRLLLQGLRDQGRLSRVHLRRAQEARLGRRSHRGREGGDRAGRRQQRRRRFVGDRPLRRHPACCDPARLHPVRQWQGARQCMEPARSDPGAPRADLFAAARPCRQIPHAPRRHPVPRAQCRLLGPEGGGGQGPRQRVPAHPHLGPAGRIRRRRRGDPLQQVARRAAAGHVHRDQSRGRRCARHQGRGLGLGDGRRRTTGKPA